jgi:hypothetical protein
MRLPTVTLEGRKLPRLVFSVKPPDSSRGLQEISGLMRKTYESGAWCFDLPSARHVQSFRELAALTQDEDLLGIPHIDAAEAVSLSGIPLRRAESKVIGTVMKNLFPPDLVKELRERGFWSSSYFFPHSGSLEVFTQKEIARITFNPSSFDRALSPFQASAFPFLRVGGKYADWLLGLGCFDLLRQIIGRVREKGFMPILSGQWATFFLPKVKSLESAAFAVPINKLWGFFEHGQACDLIKRFDRPVISLDPLAGKTLLERSAEAFPFLFEELKIHLAIAEVSSETDLDLTLNGIEKIPSLRPHRRAG